MPRGLFDNADDEQEFAFRVTIERINNDNGVLLRSRLVPRIERLDKDDSFRATKKECRQDNLRHHTPTLQHTKQLRNMAPMELPHGAPESSLIKRVASPTF
ncbi:hypothetical protein MTO96_010938 [Rhipicephalus appendiculatus]